jgi:integrase
MLEQYLRQLRAIRKPKCVEVYDLAARKLEKFLDGRNISQSLLQEWVITLVEEGYSPSSIQTYSYGALDYLQWKHENGLCEEMKLPKLPSLVKRLKPHITEDVLISYMTIAKEVPEPYATALLLLPLSGLRVGEMVQLKVVDVSYKKPWGYVFSVCMGSGQNVKRNKERRVPTLKSAYPILKRYLENVRRNMDGPWLFPNVRDYNKHIEISRMQFYVREIRGRVGILDLTPHTLRHVFENILEKAGVHAFKIMQLLGHSNMRTSLVYSDPSDEPIFAELEKVKLDLEEKP